MGIWNKEAIDAEVKPPENDTKPPEKSAAELIAEAMKPLTDQFASINSRFDAIDAKITPKKVEPTESAALTSVFEDENVAFNQRITPLLLRQLEVEARIVRGDIRREYESAGFGGLWSTYESQINKILDESPVVDTNGKTLRGDPGYVRNVVDMVLGRAAREKGIRFDGTKQSFFLEGASAEDGMNTTPKDDGLTEKQRKMFARMGISADDAKKTMSKLEFVN